MRQGLKLFVWEDVLQEEGLLDEVHLLVGRTQAEVVAMLRAAALTGQKTPMKLTNSEILFLLNCVERTYGFGYAKDPKVSRLQAKLSIFLEANQRLGDQTADDPDQRIELPKVGQ
jgi:hypothetical protein